MVAKDKYGEDGLKSYNALKEWREERPEYIDLQILKIKNNITKEQELIEKLKAAKAAYTKDSEQEAS